MSPFEPPPVSTDPLAPVLSVLFVLFPTPDTFGCRLAVPSMADTFGVNGLGPAGLGVLFLLELGVEASLLWAILLALALAG